jgi:hypothetical protein
MQRQTQLTCFYYWHRPKEGLFDRLQFIVVPFSIYAIADYKQLHVLKHRDCSKKMVLVAID